MIVIDNDTLPAQGRDRQKDNQQDTKLDSLQSAVDALNDQVSAINASIQAINTSIDDKYAAQTQTLMSALTNQINALSSSLETLVNTQQMTAKNGTFETLSAAVSAIIKSLNATSATIAETLNVRTITALVVGSDNVNADNLTANLAQLERAIIGTVEISEFIIGTLRADSVIAGEAEIETLESKDIKTEKLSAKYIGGTEKHEVIGEPDNTELLEVSVPFYRGIQQLIDDYKQISITINDNNFITWTESVNNLYKIAVDSQLKKILLYFKADEGYFPAVFNVLRIGAPESEVITSRIVDRTDYRQNVLTKQGSYGSGSGSGSGTNIVFYDSLPDEGEEGFIYVEAAGEIPALVWHENRYMDFIGSNVERRLQQVELRSTENETAIAMNASAIASNREDIASNSSAIAMNASAIAAINGNDAGLSMRQVAQDVAGNVYIPCGSVLFANLPSLSSARIGDVYNVEDSFTTTADFVEGAGIAIAAGSNVVAVDINGTKKWDVLGLSVDTSSFMQKHNPTGTGAFSMGRKANTAIGYNSHAEGYATTANGDYSHAEGYATLTIADANHAHVEGYFAHAYGAISHAEGNNTIAKSSNQHVQGIYNVADDNNKYADIVGGGTSSARKNIEATTWTGDKRLKGTVYVGCNDDSTGGDALVAVSHNIPRLMPKDITAYFNDGSLWDRLRGTNGYSYLEDLYAGDYFQFTTNALDTYFTNWVVIAEINGLMNGPMNDGTINFPHLVMVPGKGTGFSYDGQLPFFDVDSRNLSNGYRNVLLTTYRYNGTVELILRTYFGAHLIPTIEWVSSVMDSTFYNRQGKATGGSAAGVFEIAYCIDMSEIELFGSVKWGSSGFDEGLADHQFALFRHRPDLIKDSSLGTKDIYWLRCATSATEVERSRPLSSQGQWSSGFDDIYGQRPRFVIGTPPTN